jgi:hypothetical protein
MSDIISVLLDIILIGLLITGIVYAMRLSGQIAGLRASRADMERFVVDFSSTVQRAEAGVRGLKQAARSGGDDLEEQIDKANKIRDELLFLVESADQIATRLSDIAASAARTLSKESGTSTASEAQSTIRSVTEENAGSIAAAPPPIPEMSRPVALSTERKSKDQPKTAAERELMRALEKAG